MFQYWFHSDSAGDFENFDETVHRTLSVIALEKRKTIFRIDESAARLMEMYSWPGSLEEMREVLACVVETSNQGVIRLSDFPESFFKRVQHDQKTLHSRAFTTYEEFF